MKKSRILSLLKALVIIGTVQAAEPLKNGQPTVVAGTVRTKEAGRVTHERIQNAIKRQDTKKVKQLLDKLGTLELTEKEVLVKKAQDVVDQHDDPNVMFSSRSDLLLTVAGGVALTAGLLLCRSEATTLARTAYDFVQDSLDGKDTPVKAAGGTVRAPSLTQDEEMKLVLKYMASAALVVGGISALRRGLQRTKGSASLIEARKIEQMVYGSVEIGSISLNATQD